jgi:hypothetical protein
VTQPVVVKLLPPDAQVKLLPVHLIRTRLVLSQPEVVNLLPQIRRRPRGRSQSSSHRGPG